MTLVHIGVLQCMKYTTPVAYDKLVLPKVLGRDGTSVQLATGVVLAKVIV